MHIYRELQENIIRFFSPNQRSGLILTGIVGCGKTTLISSCLDVLKLTHHVLEFSGDDVQFRQRILEDTQYLSKTVIESGKLEGNSTKRPLIFVDEVQKAPEIFDALKIAFDKNGASFVVSGSNPAFLQTQAKKALQRRADLMYLLPFSIPEILAHLKLLSFDIVSQFETLIFEGILHQDLPEVELTSNIQKVCREYLMTGGFPLAYLARDTTQKMIEVRKVVERGFEILSDNNDRVSELIKIELAELHSKDFTYQGIFQRTRLRRRERVNHEIDRLFNHGYINRRVPVLLHKEKRTYLSILSFVDPGIVTYLTGNRDLPLEEFGFRVEGVVHTRLDWLAKKAVYKTEVGFYKPHKIDSNGKLKYFPGEIDFIVKQGRRIIPIEVKHGENLNNFDLSGMKAFLNAHSSVQFGVVLYGGVPRADFDHKIIYWPWWGV